MSDNSFPITPVFQFFSNGKMVSLENRQLFTILYELWKRVGGAAETPDLTDINTTVGVLEDDMSVLTSLVNEAQNNIFSLGSQLNALEQLVEDLNIRVNILDAAENIDDLLGMVADMNEFLAEVADKAFQS